MKLKLLVDLEIMRLGLIPFDVDASAVMADWSEDRKRKHFRKFRKLVRKAARFTVERELRLLALPWIDGVSTSAARFSRTTSPILSPRE